MLISESDYMMLKRYDLCSVEGVADPADSVEMEQAPLGVWVKFEDVITLMHSARLTAEAFDAAGNSPRNQVFNRYPNEVWNAVCLRDSAIGALIWEEFATANGV
jgi:hypothetical protein